MTIPQLYIGVRDPEAFSFTITDPTFDFATVTGTDFQVFEPGGIPLVWAWAFDISVPGKITLTHTFSASGNDVKRRGRYSVTGFLLTASSRRRIEPEPFDAIPYM